MSSASVKSAGSKLTVLIFFFKGVLIPHQLDSVLFSPSACVRARARVCVGRGKAASILTSSMQLLELTHGGGAGWEEGGSQVEVKNKREEDSVTQLNSHDNQRARRKSKFPSGVALRVARQH